MELEQKVSFVGSTHDRVILSIDKKTAFNLGLLDIMGNAQLNQEVTEIENITLVAKDAQYGIKHVRDQLRQGLRRIETLLPQPKPKKSRGAKA